MMGRIPAYAAFANAALLLAVIAVFAFVPMGTLWKGWTPAFLILAGPIPLATAVAVWGLVRRPASNMRFAERFGAFFLALQAAVMCGAALITLDTIARQDNGTWAFLVSFLALYPIFVLGGLGALCIGAARFAGSDAPNWLAPLGLVAVVAGVLIAAGSVPILIATIALVLWWALLGAMLFFYKPSQAARS
jgi:hypothetical protein